MLKYVSYLPTMCATSYFSNILVKERKKSIHSIQIKKYKCQQVLLFKK